VRGVKYAVLFALACACGCSQPATRNAGGHGPTAPAGEPPRLVVLLVIDQWPEWAFEGKREALTGGFARVLGEGEWHVGRYQSAAMNTAPGHATLGTGKASAETGILANIWWHRDVGREVAAVEDLDGSVTNRWLRVPGLGDIVTRANTGAKAVGVALKDRAAVLMMGHAGLAIWYDAKQTGWTTFAPAPAWLAAWNESHPVSARLHEVWQPLDRTQLATLSGVADDQPGEVGEKTFGATFPHDPQATKNPADAVFAMPLGTDLTFDTAGAAIDAEHLGADATPDMLAISISSHDYIGHGWGQESWEAWDFTLRMDRRLGAFLDELDAKVGAGKWAMIVTSDHGASPLPERVGGGRLTTAELKTAANNAASAVLGAGEWIDDLHYPYVYFSKPALAQPPKELESAAKRVVNALRSFPGIARADRVAPYVGNCDHRTGVARELCNAFDAERSGDIFFAPARGWIVQDADEPLATAHGSLNDYDQQVPLIYLPPGRKSHAAAPAPIRDDIDMRTVAPTLLTWLGLKPEA
jgi:hypothetical protein